MKFTVAALAPLAPAIAAATRTLGQRHYETQLMAGYALRRAVRAGMRVPPAAFGALRALAQWSAERRHAGIRMQNLKHDRQLNQVLAFTGKGE